MDTRPVLLYSFIIASAADDCKLVFADSVFADGKAALMELLE